MRQRNIRTVCPFDCISIHAPMKDATSFQILVHRNHTYFNPRTHEGRNQTRTEVRTEHVISIHAPMKDATIVTSFPFSTSLISIHAPMKDATRLRWIELKLKQISIHAPMKDATLSRRAINNISVNFNPLTHEGCDSNHWVRFFKLCRFQSTHP